MRDLVSPVGIRCRNELGDASVRSARRSDVGDPRCPRRAAGGLLDIGCWTLGRLGSGSARPSLSELGSPPPSLVPRPVHPITRGGGPSHGTGGAPVGVSVEKVVFVVVTVVVIVVAVIVSYFGCEVWGVLLLPQSKQKASASQLPLGDCWEGGCRPCTASRPTSTGGEVSHRYSEFFDWCHYLYWWEFWSGVVVLVLLLES